LSLYLDVRLWLFTNKQPLIRVSTHPRHFISSRILKIVVSIDHLTWILKHVMILNSAFTRRLYKPPRRLIPLPRLSAKMPHTSHTGKSPRFSLVPRRSRPERVRRSWTKHTSQRSARRRSEMLVVARRWGFWKKVVEPRKVSCLPTYPFEG
jgi:hypothetical protein